MRIPFRDSTLSRISAIARTPSSMTAVSASTVTKRCVLLLYLIAELVFGRRTALAAGWIAAAFPPFVFMPAALLAENLFVPLVLGATWATLAYRRSPRWWWLVAAGAFCGAAALTRTNGILVLLVAAVAVLLAQPHPRLRLRALAAPAAVCAVAVLAIAPWTIRNARAFHAFV